MRKILLFTVFVLLPVFSSAQGRVTLEMQNRSFAELAETLSRQAGVRVFYVPEEVVEISVTVSAVDMLPADIIREVMAGSGIEVSVYGSDIFVLRGRKVLTELPAAYFGGPSTGERYDLSWLGSFGQQDDRRASSASKIYEIGNSLATPAAKAIVEGHVYDFKTGDPLQGVTLYLPSTGTRVVTDKEGRYRMELPTGRQEITLEGMEMENTTRQLQLYSDGTLDIEIAGQVHAIDEITVSSQRLENVRGTVLGVEHLRMAEVKNIPTAFGEADILRIIMSLPGVKTASEASSGFNVRGGATDQNLILFNDGVVYNPTHLFGFFSAFNSDLVDEMELYKSSIPAKYGGRISSVLDITTRDGNMEQYNGSASIGLLTSRLSFEGPIVKDKTSFLLGGRTTYSDWILRQLPEKSGYRDGNAGFYDLNAVISHKFSEKDRLQVSGYYSRDRFHLDKEEKYFYQNANASIKWRHIFSDTFLATFTAGYDHYDHNTSLEQKKPTDYSYSFGIDQFFGKADFVMQLGSDHTLDFGLSTIHYNLNPGKYLPKGGYSIVGADRMQHEKGLESAVYISDRWDISHALSLNVGVRYSMFNVLGPREYIKYDSQYLPSADTALDTLSGSGVLKTYHGPEFRVSARYEFTDGFSIKAGFNTMRQNIHKVSNTTVISPTDTWKLSDVNIKPQTGMQAAFGVYKNFAGNTIETSVEGYYKTMKNYLDYRGGAELVMNHHLETDVLPTEGRAYGIEVMIKKNTGKLNGWVSYSYSRTELRQNDSKITLPVNDGDWYPADYDKPHEIKFVGNYKITQRFSFSMNVDYSTGRPVTLPVSKYIYSGNEYVYYSDRNGYRIPDYFRMDASFNVEPRHRHTQRTHSSFTFGVYNLTGRKNAYSVYYKQEDGVLRGYKMAIFGVPIPYASYNIKF